MSDEWNAVVYHYFRCAAVDDVAAVIAIKDLENSYAEYILCAINKVMHALHCCELALFCYNTPLHDIASSKR